MRPAHTALTGREILDRVLAKQAKQVKKLSPQQIRARVWMNRFNQRKYEDALYDNLETLQDIHKSDADWLPSQDFLKPTE